MKSYKDLTEIEQIPFNGYNALGFFVGAGGSCLGVRAAGVEVKAVNEFIPAAINCYKKNHRGVKVLEGDIRNITGKQMMELGEITSCDIVYGSPPCASFSANGLKEKAWGKEKNYSDTTQRVDDLFFEFIRVVNEIRPKVVIAENVKGLTQGASAKVLVKIRKEFRKIGYKIDCKVLDASKFGVPQKRERLIFIGVRKDLGISPTFPLGNGKYMTCREAIEEYMDDLEGDITFYSKGTRLREMVDNYLPPLAGPKEIKEIQEKYYPSIFESAFRRDKWDVPSYTVSAQHALMHPMLNRWISVREARRLMGFPDDFVLDDTPSKNYERLGRALCPAVMEEVVNHVCKNILDKVRENENNNSK